MKIKNKMQVLVSHPTGNSNVRAIIKGLDEADLLFSFATTISINPEKNWVSLLPSKIKRELMRRVFPVSRSKINTFPFTEIARILLPKIGMQKIIAHEKSSASIDSVYKNLDSKVASELLYGGKEQISAVYCYEDGALQTFKKAKQLGVKCIYDLPIAYWQTVHNLLKQEAERLPNWAITLGGGINDSQEKLDQKTKEFELADVIITPSKFVADSLPDKHHGKSVVISPFGSPPQSEVQKKQNNLNRPLRVLFAGSMGQRKGLADLFKAIKMLGNDNIELVVLGSLLAPMSFYRKELSNFKYEPPRPHSAVLELMQTCDILCLPSIAEGRALVMQEAMSQGLPIIVTANTGGEDLVIENTTGFLVPTDAPSQIAEKIEWFASNRRLINDMSNCAIRHAEKYTWTNYTDTIISGINK